MRGAPLLSVLLAALAVAPALGAPSPAAFFGPLPDLDEAAQLPAGTVSSGEEPMILISGSTILVGDTAGIHRSTNGGATWTHANVGQLPGAFTDGRALARDAAGTVYAATTNGQLISVGKSTNNGASWTTTSYAASVAVIADRPWLTAGAAGEVVLVTNNVETGENCHYSNDGGTTWLKRSITNTAAANAGNVVLDAQGRIWYAASGAVRRWNPLCTGGVQFGFLPSSGAQIFTPLALSSTGDAYVAQPSVSNGAMELVGMHGLNSGSTKRLVVSEATQRSNTFGAIAMRNDNEVAIAWYASASAGNPSASGFSGTWDVYVARVRDFWTATPQVRVDRVSTEPNHAGWFCMGGVGCTSGRGLYDYQGVAYDTVGGVHVAYGHDRDSASHVRYAVFPAWN